MAVEQKRGQMGKNAKRKQHMMTIECVTNVVYENITKVLGLDAENNYQKRKQVSLLKLRRVYSQLSNQRKAVYITVECLGCIELCMQRSRTEFELQHAVLTDDPGEKRKLENLLSNWEKLKEKSYREISEFLLADT